MTQVGDQEKELGYLWANGSNRGVTDLEGSGQVEHDASHTLLFLLSR